MNYRQHPVDNILRYFGILSPYAAVALLFWCGNGFAAVLLYHFILLISIIGINRTRSLKILTTGFYRRLIFIICLGALLPGIIIFYMWPIAKLDTVTLSELFQKAHLSKPSFVLFAVYACLINPFLEESFWRGCFKNTARGPNIVDLLFAGYHILILITAVKPIFCLPAFILLTGVSCLFRNIYRITGGLLIPVLTHLAADIAIFFAVYTLMR